MRRASRPCNSELGLEISISNRYYIHCFFVIEYRILCFQFFLSIITYSMLFAYILSIVRIFILGFCFLQSLPNLTLFRFSRAIVLYITILKVYFFYFRYRTVINSFSTHIFND